MEFLHRLVHKYEAIHTVLGILGNIMFVGGSVLFLEAFKDLKPVAVWLFIFGSSFMLLGALGAGLKRCWRYFEGKPQPEDAMPEVYGNYDVARLNSAAGAAATQATRQRAD